MAKQISTDPKFCNPGCALYRWHHGSVFTKEAAMELGATEEMWDGWVENGHLVPYKGDVEAGELLGKDELAKVSLANVPATSPHVAAANAAGNTNPDNQPPKK